jgi:hypothetical protein
MPSRLSLISLMFFGSDSGPSPLSWAAAADYVEILCSRVGCVTPIPADRCDGKGTRPFLAPVMPKRRASRALLAEGVPVDI